MEGVRITITVPVELRRYLKIRAAENDRSLTGEIVRSLKIGSGWSRNQETKSVLIDECRETFGEAAARQLTQKLEAEARPSKK